MIWYDWPEYGTTCTLIIGAIKEAWLFPKKSPIYVKNWSAWVFLYAFIVKDTLKESPSSRNKVWEIKDVSVNSI